MTRGLVDYDGGSSRGSRHTTAPGVDVKIARTLKAVDAAAIIVSTALCAAVQVAVGNEPGSVAVTAGLAGVWCSAVFLAHAASASTISDGSTGAVRSIVASFYTFGLLALAAVITGVDFARVPLVVALPFGLGVMLLARLAVRGRVRRRPTSLQRARAFLDDVASPQGSTWPATTGDPHASARTPRRTR